MIRNFANCETPVKEDGLLKQLTKRLVEKALQSEMNNHLGYDKYCHTDSDNVRNGRNVKNLVTNNGVVEIEVPRDRSSTFEPALIPKRQRRIEGFDDKIMMWL
ncbi:transposase [Candidatus Tisiphia endosymbiont of Parasteatoda lunata]|uniref:transposase n=1 Tax=Candidatus Tisiphia endosymbiont of Parasteatoda lunata TaxID=3066275 RepID=UPI00313D2655